MQGNHIFFGTLAHWLDAIDTHGSVFGLPISLSERTNLDGVRQVSLLVHLSQINGNRIYHCLILVAQYFEPPMRDEVPPLRARLETAWQSIKRWLSEKQIDLIEAVVAYPKNTRTLTVPLPPCFRGEEAQTHDQA